MSNGTYNGWTNYETWCVKLWQDNDGGSYRYWSGIAKMCFDEVDGDQDKAKANLAYAMKDDYTKGKDALLEAGKATASVWSDLLGRILERVNWEEIAGHMIDDLN